MKLSFTIITFIMISVSFGQPSSKEIMLIPKGYTGFVYVIFNQPAQKKVEIENKTRIYRIPNDGILLTQSKPENGVLAQKFYYVDSLGKKTRIPKQSGTSILTETPVITYSGSIEVLYDKFNANNPIEYLKVIISKKSDQEKISSTQYQLEFEKKASLKLERKFSTVPEL